MNDLSSIQSAKTQKADHYPQIKVFKRKERGSCCYIGFEIA